MYGGAPLVHTKKILFGDYRRPRVTLAIHLGISRESCRYRSAVRSGVASLPQSCAAHLFSGVSVTDNADVPCGAGREVALKIGNITVPTHLDVFLNCRLSPIHNTRQRGIVANPTNRQMQHTYSAGECSRRICALISEGFVR